MGLKLQNKEFAASLSSINNCRRVVKNSTLAFDFMTGKAKHQITLLQFGFEPWSGQQPVEELTFCWLG